MPLEQQVAKVPVLAELLAGRLEREASAAIAARGRFSIAVPGGSVAVRFFPRLAAAAVDWSRTDFFQADERAVPPGDPDSNFAALSRLWLEPAGVPPARIHRMEGEDPDPNAAARRSAHDLTRTLGEPARLDVVLLGAGPDGHVASLFPDHPALRATRPAVAVHDSPKPPPGRLTLTLPVLTSARLVVIAVLGAEKAAMVRRWLGDPESDLPVARVARTAERVLLLLDPEAAG